MTGWGSFEGTEPTADDAERRAPCFARTRNGTVVATLVYVPDAARGGRSPGAKVRVRLASGAVLSLPLTDVLTCSRSLETPR